MFQTTHVMSQERRRTCNSRSSYSAALTRWGVLTKGWVHLQRVIMWLWMGKAWGSVTGKIYIYIYIHFFLIVIYYIYSCFSTVILYIQFLIVIYYMATFSYVQLNIYGYICMVYIYIYIYRFRCVSGWTTWDTEQPR